MVNGGKTKADARVHGSSPLTPNFYSPFTIYYSRAPPSALGAAHGGVEEARGVEEVDGLSVAAEGRAHGRRRRRVGRRLEVVGRQGHGSARPEGERKLFVAHERDDEPVLVGDAVELQTQRLEQPRGVDDGAHTPAHGEDAEDGRGGVRQRCRLRPTRDALALVRVDGEGEPAEAH